MSLAARYKHQLSQVCFFHFGANLGRFYIVEETLGTVNALVSIANLGAYRTPNYTSFVFYGGRHLAPGSKNFNISGIFLQVFFQF